MNRPVASMPAPSASRVSLLTGIVRWHRLGLFERLRGRVRLLRRGLLLLLLLLLVLAERVAVLLVASALRESGARDDERDQQHEDEQGLWSGAHGGYW